MNLHFESFHFSKEGSTKLSVFYLKSHAILFSVLRLKVYSLPSSISLQIFLQFPISCMCGCVCERETDRQLTDGSPSGRLSYKPSIFSLSIPSTTNFHVTRWLLLLILFGESAR